MQSHGFLTIFFTIKEETMAKVKSVSGKPFKKGNYYVTTKDLGLKPLEVRSGTL